MGNDEVKRFVPAITVHCWIDGRPQSGASMIPDSEGDFVRFSDFEAVLKRATEAEAKLEEIRKLNEPPLKGSEVDEYWELREKLSKIAGNKGRVKVERDEAESWRLNQALLTDDARIKELEAERDELVDALGDAISQATWEGSGENEVYDSGALSAYARGLHLLAKYGEVEIVSEHGRRIIAKPVKKEGVVGNRGGGELWKLE
jgi:hypothetical protein